MSEGGSPCNTLSSQGREKFQTGRGWDLGDGTVDLYLEDEGLRSHVWVLWRFVLQVPDSGTARWIVQNLHGGSF